MISDADRAYNIFMNAGTSKGENKHQESSSSSNYKVLNRSLILRIRKLEFQLSNANQQVDKLRKENLELRDKNRKIVEAIEDEDRIELIVAQRVQRRLTHIAAIGQRTIQFLQNQQTELESSIGDIINKDDSNKRKQLLAEPSLDNVSESPVSHINKTNEPKSSTKVDDVKPQSARKSRRSALFDINPCTNDTPKARDRIIQRKAPLIIEPNDRNEEKLEAQHFNGEILQQPKPTIKRIRGNSPAPLAGSSSRPQRSAKMKISTFKEPTMNEKLRRPGKNDEPLPYIGTFSLG